MSALLVAVAAGGLARGPHSLPAYLLFGYAFAMSVNALIPHLIASVVMRRYMPGTATGVLLVLPLGSVLLWRAVTLDWVSLATLIWAAPAVAVALLGAIPLLFAAGQRIFPQGSQQRRQSSGAA